MQLSPQAGLYGCMCAMLMQLAHYSSLPASCAVVVLSGYDYSFDWCLNEQKHLFVRVCSPHGPRAH